MHGSLCLWSDWHFGKNKTNQKNYRWARVKLYRSVKRSLRTRNKSGQWKEQQRCLNNKLSEKHASDHDLLFAPFQMTLFRFHLLVAWAKLNDGRISRKRLASSLACMPNRVKYAWCIQICEYESTMLEGVLAQRDSRILCFILVWVYFCHHSFYSRISLCSRAAWNLIRCIVFDNIIRYVHLKPQNEWNPISFCNHLCEWTCESTNIRTK